MQAFVTSLSAREAWEMAKNTPPKIMFWNLLLGRNFNDELYGSPDGLPAGKEVPTNCVAYEDGKPVSLRELSMGKTIVLNFGSCT